MSRPDDDARAGDRLEEILGDAAPREEAPVEPPPDPTLEESLWPFGIPGEEADEATRGTPGDAGDAPGEGDEPGDRLPDAPLFALLRTIRDEVLVERIDHVWIFPPRRLQAGETAVVVVAAYHETDPERRRVLAAHYTAQADVKEPRLALDEYGSAPTERVGRLVEDVVARLKDEPAAAPRAARIDGEPERWHRLLHELAEAYLEEAQRDRRLR